MTMKRPREKSNEIQQEKRAGKKAHESESESETWKE